MTHSFSLGAIDAHDKTARREPRGHLPRLTNRFLIGMGVAKAGSGHGGPERHQKDNRGDGRVLLTRNDYKNLFVDSLRVSLNSEGF